MSECVATPNDVVDSCATPALTVTGLPHVEPPSLNWTVPVAVAGVTVALRTTVAPCVAGDAGETERTVDVLIASTVNELADEVDAV